MSAASGQVLDIALDQLGWRDLLASLPEVAIPMVFRLLGETGAHAPILNDVMLARGRARAGRHGAAALRRGLVGGVGAERLAVGRARRRPAAAAGSGRSGRRGPAAALAALAALPPALGAGRRAVGWWLVGTGQAMLALARSHALDRVQFGRPLASFQAVRHRLAETLVALEGAEATLAAADALAGASAGNGLGGAPTAGGGRR